MLEAPDIRGDVSPSMHPTSLAAHARALDVQGTMGQHVYTDAHTALTVAYSCMGSLLDVRRDVEKNFATRREIAIEWRASALGAAGLAVSFALRLLG